MAEPNPHEEVHPPHPKPHPHEVPPYILTELLELREKVGKLESMIEVLLKQTLNK